MTGRDNKLYKMVSLPEFYIYGWIFQINSASPELKKYKWEVYQILYNYFKGSVFQRKEFLKIKTLADIEIEHLERNLEKSADYLRITELKKQKKNASSKLNKLDKDIVTGQYDLWADSMQS